MILADKIIALRKKLGWSQEQLANELGISRQSVSKWESGMSIPDLDKIIKLSALFGVSTDYLLKDELELETPSESRCDEDGNCRMVDAEEAGVFMQMVENVSKIMASAVSLLILSPIPLLLLGGFAESRGNEHPGTFMSEDMAGGIGMTVLLILVIIGAVTLILNGMKLSKYEYLEKEIFVLQYGVEGIVSKKKAEFEPQFRTSIALGVGLCIAGLIPMMIAGGMNCSDFVAVCMVCVLLTCVSIAVFFFVNAGMIYGSYEKLLQEGDYTPEEKEANRKIEYFPGIYWCIVTAVYLGISFLEGSWDRSWVVWPVAGVLFAALTGILKAIVRERNKM